MVAFWSPMELHEPCRMFAAVTPPARARRKEIRATVVADPHNAGTLRDGVAEVVAERPIDGPLQGGGAT